VAIGFPSAPPAIGEVADVEISPGVTLRLRGVADGLWRTNVHGNMQWEIHRAPDGGYEVLTTTGAWTRTYRGGTWREAMTRGLV